MENNEIKVGKLIFDGDVTKVPINAFENNTKLQLVILPNSITEIGLRGFCGCVGITSIVLPDSIERISSWCFFGNRSLESITIPESVTSIEDAAFAGTGLNAVGMSKNIKRISSYVFDNTPYINNGNNYENGLLYIDNALIKATDDIPLEVVVKDGTTCVADRAFVSTKAKSVLFPDGCIYIGSGMFSASAGITKVVLPEGVTEIKHSTFSNCSLLTSVVIPNSVTSIGNYAFDGCYSLTSITIPNSVTSIGDYAFYDCYHLTSIIIPDSVTSIGEAAFNGCNALTDITIPEGVKILSGTFYRSGLINITLKGHTPPRLSSGSSTFHSCPLQNIYVPEEALEVYKSAPLWSDYADLIQPIPES